MRFFSTKTAAPNCSRRSNEEIEKEVIERANTIVTNAICVPITPTCNQKSQVPSRELLLGRINRNQHEGKTNKNSRRSRNSAINQGCDTLSFEEMKTVWKCVQTIERQ